MEQRGTLKIHAWSDGHCKHSLGAQTSPCLPRLSPPLSLPDKTRPQLAVCVRETWPGRNNHPSFLYCVDWLYTYVLYFFFTINETMFPIPSETELHQPLSKDPPAHSAHSATLHLLQLVQIRQLVPEACDLIGNPRLNGFQLSRAETLVKVS